MLRSTCLRHALGILKQHQKCTSSIPNPVLSSDKVQDEVPTDIQNKVKVDDNKNNVVKEDVSSVRSNLVKVAFASLKHNQSFIKTASDVDEKIKEAKTAEELLRLSEQSYITRKQALKIVSTLSDLSLKGETKDLNLESDIRFSTLCQIIGKNTKSVPYSPIATRNGDLSLVLGVTGEDEASKIIDTLNLHQMIKVLISLSIKKRRSLPLLKSLAFNIGRIPSKLDIKQSADILYAVSSLNFPDEVLLEKVCSDLAENLPNCQKSAVFGSICTSLGYLRYKDSELLTFLCDWGLKRKDICRTQDLVSLLLCLVNVRHTPDQQLLDIFSKITEGELPSASTWLDVVWSLSLFGVVSESQLSSVLNPKFVDRLRASAAGSSWKRKVLNLNGVAKWTKGYKGPLLSDDSDMELTMGRNKEKQLIVNSVLDTLSNLFPSSHYYKSCVDSGMGFIIDAECIVDAKMNPSLLVDKKTGQPIEDNLTGKKNRIALFVHEYHDCTRGLVEPAGPAHFNTHLAALVGYKVINIMYTDYNPRAKLIQRVQYIEKLLKSTVSEDT